MASTTQPVKGLDTLLRAMRQLPPEIVSKRGGPLRRALFAAARIVRDEARRRAPVLEQPLPGKRGEKEPAGTLRDNIVVMLDHNPRANGASERYGVGVRHGKRQKHDAFYWRFVEFGHRIVSRKPKGSTWKQHRARATEAGGLVPAKPFLRPAFEATKNAALTAFVESLRAGVQRAVKKAAGK